MNNTHKGGCLCGSIRYEAREEPVIVVHCHCEDCQRASGAGHSTVAMFALDDFKITGKIAEYKLEADNGREITRVFCPKCGSSILGRNNETPDHISITLGTLDDSSTFKPQAVVFARNRKAWDVMDEDLPTFETQPDWKPGDAV